RLHVLADHVPGRLRPAAHAAQLQPAALAQGEVRNPGVGAEHALLRVADLARARREVVRQEFAEIAFADEADAGRVLFLRGGQAGLGGDRPDLALGQVAEREQRRGQRLLPEQVQEVALVLAAIARAQQLPAPALARDPGVMPGGDARGTELAR